MATLFVTASGPTDFQGGPSENNIDRIEFQSPGPNASVAIFGSAQFGPGLISNSSTIAGDGFSNTLEIELASGASFSAAGLQFVNWQAGVDVVFFSGTGGSETITGSSQKDRFGAVAGADHIDAGAGDDEIQVAGTLSAGTTIEGGTQATADEALLLFSTSFDLRPAQITGVERLRFGVNNSSATVGGDQIGAGGFSQIDASIYNVSLLVTGNAVDLSGVSFLNWNDSIIIAGGSSGTSTLVGSDQPETIIALGTSTSTITGGRGADQLLGAGGNDIFRYLNTVDAVAGETVDGGSGTDSIQIVGNASVSFEFVQIDSIEQLRLPGAGAQAQFTGSQIGSSEIDQVIGGRGVQTLVVTTDNQILDLLGVTFTTWDDTVDVINLFGSPGLQDILMGSDQADRIDGRDQADFMSGRGGNDTYFVDVANDAVVEAAGAGIDSVIATSSYVLASGQEIENLTLAGTANNDATGNGFANLITGNSGNNRIVGGGGTDTLIGGEGNDTYVNAAGDVVTEGANGGTDTFESDATATLAANVERLFLTGSAVADGTGNDLANQVNGNGADNVLLGLGADDTLAGGAGADTLNGGAGIDRLTGGTQRDKLVPGTDANADTLVFGALNDSTGVTRDVITGLDLAGEDKLDLPVVPVAIAAAITAGTLSTASFNTDLAAAVTAARLGAGQAVLFDPNAGNLDQAGMVYLIVDANGIAGYQANADWVFQLENHTGTLTTDDFV